MNDEITGL